MKTQLTIIFLSASLLTTACMRSESTSETQVIGQGLACQNTQVMYDANEIEGWIDFEANEGVSKDVINEALKDLDLPEFDVPYLPYSLEPIQELKAKLTDSDEVAVPTEEDFLKLMQVNGYTDTELIYTEGVYAMLFFPQVLTAEEKDNVSNLLTEAGIRAADLTWSEIPASRWGSVMVQAGEEAVYIEKLQTLNLFRCVGQRHETKLWP